MRGAVPNRLNRIWRIRTQNIRATWSCWIDATTPSTRWSDYLATADRNAAHLAQSLKPTLPAE
ncbi:hypothetical protein ACIRG5_28165 [Lentzea sp. NPDC102401]|uniref:hypothetical protein n=1 Tax=Lentzea sp. NPDC102401 TaxID=3364128 RepID=UPI00381CCEBA